MKEKFSGKQILILATCVLLVAIVAIGFIFFGKSTPTSGPTTFAIKEISSDEVKLSEETIKLKTKCDSKDVEIAWSCSNENKATVKDGVVTLREAGIVIVEAQVVGTDLSDEVILSIINDVPEPATGVEIVNKPTETITFEEQTIYLTHQLLPDNATFEEVEYTSSDKSIATVDAAGKVTIVAPGTVTIRVALVSNPDIYDECTLDIEWDRFLSDDGTFEGKKGGISLYSPSVTDVVTNEQYKFQNPLTFKKIKKNDGTSALSVVAEGTAWDTLFIKFDQPVKKGETYLISYQADWKAAAEPNTYGYAIIPNAGNWVVDEPDNIVNSSTDVKWYDGNVQIPFTANADLSSLYLVLVNQNNDICMDMVLDNIRLASADGVILSAAVYNDDGTFEGKSGIFSLLSPHMMEINQEGYGWSTQVKFDKIKNNDGTAIQVTSSGDHNIDYLYVKVDSPIKKNYKYAVSMDLEALDEQCKNGHYGYWILSPEANTGDYVQFFQEVKNEDLFKKDSTFEFISNGDYEYFYLLLREYTLEDSGETDAKFNFSVDNISFEEVEFMGDTSYLNDNGTFEGVSGNISLYSPTVTSEIKSETYHSYNPILFKQIEKKDGTHALSVESSGSNWDTLFMKFNYPVKRGATYEITYDAAWNGAKEPAEYMYGYAVMPNTSNWVTDEVSNLLNFSSDVKWYDGQVKITFTANADLNSWYLVLVDQTAEVPLDMEIDNINVIQTLGSVANDDGTFEGISGMYSLMTPHQIEGAEGFGWSTKVYFDKVENADGHAIAVTSEGDHHIDYLYVKVDTAIKKNYKYSMKMDLEALDEQCANGQYGYWVLAPDANIGNFIQTFQTMDNAELFKEDAELSFISNGNYDYFYLVLREFTPEDSGLTDGKFNFTIDNIRFEELEHMGDSSVLNDDGTFEGIPGKISLLSPHDISDSFGFGWAPTLSFKAMNDDNNTKYAVKSTGNNQMALLYVKVDKKIKENGKYTVYMDIAALDDIQKSGSWYYWVCSPDAAIETGNGKALIQEAQPVTAANFLKEDSVFTFTSNADYDYFYILICENGSSGVNVPFNFSIDNVVVEADESNAKKEDTTKFVEEVTLQGTGPVYSLKNLKPGTKYKLTVEAVGSPSVVISNNKNGSVYDGISFYTKTKLITADKDANDQPTGTYSVVFETAPIDFDEVTLTLSGTYSNAKLYEESRVEIQNIPTKNQLAANDNHTLSATLIGLDSAGAVTWKSSDESVATIDANGKVTALKSGKTEITATVTEGEDTYEDYVELYVVNASLGADAYGLVTDAASPTDFTLQIPSGEEIKVLQISDTQIINPHDLRYEGMLSASEIERWGGANALKEHCFDYLDQTFAKVETAGTIPHLVVLAGDNIYGHFDDDGAMLDALIAKMDEFCEKHDIYWTFVFGNHDKESDIGIEEIIRKYAKSDRCLYAYRNVTGDSNMSVAIKQDNEYEQIVYMFDTHNTGSASGTNQKGNRVDEYATVLQGIYDSQTEWFKSVADTYKNVPSLVYMHIAFEEYARTFAEHGYGVDFNTITTSSVDAYATAGNTYGDFGELHEKVSIWDDDTANEGTKFYRMLKDYNIKGVFCGHNHKNNYSVVTEDDIRLTFGLKSSTYDAYQEGLLGGTLTTMNAGAMTVEHIYAVGSVVQSSENVLNDDGTFEGVTGNISLYAAKDVAGAYGEGWANDLAFSPITDANGTAMGITSTGDHSYDNLFIKFNKSLVAGEEYTIHMDMKALDNVQETLSWFYWITDETGNIDANVISGPTNLTPQVLFANNGVDIKFTADKARDSFGLLLIDNGTTGKNFNFAIDNISVKDKTIAVTDSVLKDDGTFEGVAGNVSLYSPKASDVTSLTYNDFNPIVFKTVTGANGNALSAKSTGTGWDAIFIKFEESIVQGEEYTITYDATWKGATKPTVYGYSIMPTHLNWLAADDNMANFDGSVAWFDGKASIKFTANANLDTWYLVLADQNGDVPLDIELDNIKVTGKVAYPTSETVLKDDGTFEGVAGNISLYSPKASDVTSVTYNDFNPITFQKADTTTGTVLTAKSTGTGWDAIFIKFEESIKKGEEYTITYDATWKGATKPSTYGYSIMPTHLNWLAADDNMANFDGSVAWFDGKVSIKFTANADLDTWYLVLADQNGDVPLDIELDNIKVTGKTVSYDAAELILKDNGTFEGVAGNISLYSPKASDVTSITYNDFNPITFQGASTANGNVISAKSTGTGWDAIFIKFEEPIEKGKEYTITYDATWKGATKPSTYGYSIMPTHLNWLAADDNMANFDGSVEWFDGKVSIKFTANANLDTWYLVLADQNGDVPLDIELDNISVQSNSNANLLAATFSRIKNWFIDLVA